MTDLLLIILSILMIVSTFLLLLLLTRGTNNKDYQIETHLKSLENNQEKTERMLREEIAKSREETNHNAKQSREEMASSFKLVSDMLLSRMTEIATLQKNQLDLFSGQLTALTRLNEEKLTQMRQTIEESIKLLQNDNSQKLEQMRATVDEKLHATLEKRLGESFQLVSERLEMVHKGLGEMQSLAAGVGDLKKVLTNVKTRGTWGEIHLGNLLEQILTVEQYAKNVITKKGTGDRVEFAIKLPGRDDSNRNIVWLPVDAKFPQEDYQKLTEAQEQGDMAAAEEAARQLEARVKTEAKAIKEKYLDPPNTTDFGIMYLPTESLYAEVLRRPGLSDNVQREYRVVIAGPQTLAALLNSLQMGFRTLAIEKRSSEVWSLLGAVKTEFGKFGDILEKTHRKLQEASNTIVDAAQKSRTIEHKLKKVQELPAMEAIDLIGEGDPPENKAESAAGLETIE